MKDFKPRTVTIGDATWMAENLAIDDGGDGIFKNEENGEYYYTWDAAMRIAKAIPGWHLPSAVEWRSAAIARDASEIYTDNKGYMDYMGYWNYENVDVLKKELNVIFAGYYVYLCAPRLRDVGDAGRFWTSTPNKYEPTHIISLGCNLSGRMDTYTTVKNLFGLSVRLVKD